MADERDRLRARLGLPPLSATTTPAPKPTPVVDERTQRAAMAAQTPPKLTGAERAAKTIQERKDRFTAELESREASKPTEDPGPGNVWSFSVSENRWKKVRVSNVSTSGGDNNQGKGGGKTESRREYLGSGKGRVLRIYYTDGTSQDFPAPEGVADNAAGGDDAATKALIDFNKAQAEANTRAVRESAFALLKLEFDKYGLGSLVDTVKNYIMQGSPVEEVTLRLRETPEYQARFAGNQLRLKAGLNVYDEATYLQLENAYDQVFTSYGVTEAAGNTVEARRARYAQFIGGTISPDEVKGRVQLAVAAANEDEVTKATLRELYPMISEKDIVSYFLNPKETLPKLETKVRASQIGAAAVRQGLVTNVATAEELVAMGVTEDEAERAYSAYAGMKPTLDKLSGLERDQELAVNQQVAEGALLKGLASEQRKLEALRQKELARFSGSAGTARGVSLGSAAGGAI